MSAGRRIREDRESTGKFMTKSLSLRQLAKDVGIQPSYLSDLERDKRTLTLNMATRITAALYKYLGGSVHQRFDHLLIAAGLQTPERACLLALWGMSDWRPTQNVCLHGYKSEIYEALYGELDRHINGPDALNMYEMEKIT